VTWVQIQKAEEATWQDYERVAAAIGDTPPAGLLFHAAGEVDGHWRAVSVWESKDAFEAFRNERIVPAVSAALGESLAAAGPPPSEWFEVRHSIGP
jgi:quinol monooxygenase YgiN